MRRAAAVLGMLAGVAPAWGIGPEDVYLVINARLRASREIAEHYCKQRGVPADHVLAFNLPTREDMSRDDYEKRLAGPLREALKGRRDKARVLLTIYGVPLRVGRTSPSDAEKEEAKTVGASLADLRKTEADLRKEIDALQEQAKKEPRGDAPARVKAKKDELATHLRRIRGLTTRKRWLEHVDSVAAVDSELALLWHPAGEARRWIPNPLYFGAPAKKDEKAPPTLLTARLDGPDVGLIKRIIDRSVEVEKEGLKGKAYVDARGLRYNARSDTGLGYGGYDESLREMARLLETKGKMTVVLDDQGPLFVEGSCTECALYCGWYSHARFVDCCQFEPGAVGYHIASSEAVSLRNPKTRLWCQNLLQKGAVATVGPVQEPYTIGFPKPAEFFGLLATGKYTLVECYWKTNLLASWMGVLVGDPLYNPYAKAPKLDEEDVKPSPEGGSVRSIFGAP